MSSDNLSPLVTPVIVTSFRDFELEERVVRILSHRGFQIGERKIMGTRELLPEEILVTDGAEHSGHIPVITIPWQAREWDDASLQRSIQDQISPPLLSQNHWSPVLVIGEGEWNPLASELVGEINSQCTPQVLPGSPRAQVARFDERDVRAALVPTRRFEERARHARFAYAQRALFLTGVDRKDLALAHSMIEYQRRIHPHLALAFVVVGGRKARRLEAASFLEPFPMFFLEDERDDFLRIWPSHRRSGERKFSEIGEWLGSLHGASWQPRNLADRTPSRGTRPSRRTSRPMATPR